MSLRTRHTTIPVCSDPVSYSTLLLIYFTFVLKANYENASTFDGFRFARERAEQKIDQESMATKDIFKRHMVSTASDHLPFGTGKHACPVSERNLRCNVHTLGLI